MSDEESASPDQTLEESASPDQTLEEPASPDDQTVNDLEEHHRSEEEKGGVLESILSDVVEEAILASGVSGVFGESADQVAADEGHDVTTPPLNAAGSPVDQPPETGVSAQIILIVTSLGSFRRQFFDSKRAQHFLDCKGVVYHVVDINRDVSQGIDLIDAGLLEEWDSHGLLATQRSPGGVSKRATVPQVLIDGVYIGGESALQDMEEDGDFDWAAVRAACPSCLNGRDPDDQKCRHCDVQYLELIPEDVVQKKQVQRFCRGQQVVDELPISRHLTYLDVISNIESEHLETEPVTYESLFGEPPPTVEYEE